MSKEPSSHEWDSGKPVHTLVLVEDNVTFRKTLHEQLAARDFAVYDADDEKSALTQVAALHPDAVVIDWSLAKDSACLAALCKRMRELPGGKNLSLVVIDPLAGLHEDDEEIMTHRLFSLDRAKADDYTTDPPVRQLDAFAAKLNSLISRHYM